MKKSSSKASFASLASAENSQIDGKGFSGGKSDSYANLSEISKGDEDKKKKKKKKGAKSDKYEVKTSRIWSYSKPEFPLVIFGCFVAVVNGCIMPAVAFVFAEIMEYNTLERDRICIRNPGRFGSKPPFRRYVQVAHRPETNSKILDHDTRPP